MEYSNQAERNQSDVYEDLNSNGKHDLSNFKMKLMKLQFYRTKLCPWIIAAGHCRKELICHYAHSIEDLRPLPDLTKTKMCKAYLNTKQCPNITTCKFAHSPKELRATQFFSKTKLCPLWHENKCNAGSYCRFAHGYEELRINQYVCDVYKQQQGSSLQDAKLDSHQQSDNEEEFYYNMSSSIKYATSHVNQEANNSAVPLTVKDNEYLCKTQKLTKAACIAAFEGSMTPQYASDGNTESSSRFPSYLLPSGIFTPLTTQCIDYIATNRHGTDTYPSDKVFLPEQSGGSTAPTTFLVGQDGLMTEPKSPGNFKLRPPVYYNSSSAGSYLTHNGPNVMFSPFSPLTIHPITSPKDQYNKNCVFNGEANANKYIISHSASKNVSENPLLINTEKGKDQNIIITNAASKIYPYVYNSNDFYYDCDYINTPSIRPPPSSSLSSTTATTNSMHISDGKENNLIAYLHSENPQPYFNPVQIISSKNPVYPNNFTMQQGLGLRNPDVVSSKTPPSPQEKTFIETTPDIQLILENSSTMTSSINNKRHSLRECYEEDGQDESANSDHIHPTLSFDNSDDQHIANSDIYNRKKLSIDFLPRNVWNSEEKWTRSNSTDLLTRALL